MSLIGYHSGVKERNNITSFIEGNRRQIPDRVVFHWVEPEVLCDWKASDGTALKHSSMTMSEFATRSVQAAAGFKAAAIEKGDRVILFVPMSPELYVVMSALQRIGAVPVFLDSWTRRANLRSSVELVEPKAIVSFAEAFKFASGIDEIARIPLKVSTDATTIEGVTNLEDIVSTTSEAPITPLDQEDTGLVTFTTGSSGKPKGAKRSHRFLAAQHYALSKHLTYAPEDIDLPAFPIFSLNNVAAGVSTVIPAIDVGEPKPEDAKLLLAQIANCKISCITLPPSLMRALTAYCHQETERVPYVRRIVTGGAPVSRDDIRQLKTISDAEVTVLYGSTEVEPISHITDKEMMAGGNSQTQGVNVGRIDSKLRYKIIAIKKTAITIESEEDWAELETTSSPGELIVAGEHVCSDYYQNPGAFKKSKIVDTDGTKWHRSGDVVQVAEDGNLWVLGRVHNTIVRNGEYLFPVQAEFTVSSLPQVAQAAYLGVEDPELGEKAVVAVQPTKEEAITLADIELNLQKNGIVFDQVVVCDSIPMDPRHHSKVEYGALRDKLLAVDLI